MLDYAVKLTRTPHAVDQTDIHGLRDVGFEDAGILDLCQIVSYYAYANRLADGLGVELEEFWTDADLTMTRAEFDEIVSSRGVAPQ